MCIRDRAKVGAEVDDAFRQPGVMLDLLHRAAVGQAQKEQVARFDLARADELQLRAPAQVGMGEMDKAAGVALAGCLLHGYLRVVEQVAEQFAAGAFS